MNFVGLTTTIHYDAPRNIDDYFQESGRASCNGEQASSTIYWTPTDAPLHHDSTNPHDLEVVAVRRYLENTLTCRQIQLLNYFDTVTASELPEHDPNIYML